MGGTTGLGLSAAKAFVKEGASVVVIGRNPESCKKAQKDIGGGAVAIVGDASEEGIAEHAINTCIKQFGDFNALYHVAGGSGRKAGDGPIHEMTLEGWNTTLALNLTSVMLSNRAAVQQFLKDNTEGAILNMGSVLGFSPSPEYFATHAYAASKSAIIGFSKSLASYYAKKNIRVNVIAPALVETPMARRAANDEKIMSFIKTKQPLDGGRIGNARDLDGAACFLLSDRAGYITGQTLTVDGGWTISEGQLL